MRLSEDLNNKEQRATNKKAKKPLDEDLDVYYVGADDNPPLVRIQITKNSEQTKKTKFRIFN